MSAPGWQTSELDEEWPDTSLPLSTRNASSSSSPSDLDVQTSSQKFGSLRQVGSGRPSRSPFQAKAQSQAQLQATPFRIVSGHTQNSLGSLLARPPVGTTPQDAERERKKWGERLSPPSSAGGSDEGGARGSIRGRRKDVDGRPSRGVLGENDEDEDEDGEEATDVVDFSQGRSQSHSHRHGTTGTAPPGTFLVKETDEQDPRAGGPRNPFANPQMGAGAVLGGLFQPLALESMFHPPPTPPVLDLTQKQKQVEVAVGSSRSGSGPASTVGSDRLQPGSSSEPCSESPVGSIAGSAHESSSEDTASPDANVVMNRSTSPTGPVPSSLTGPSKQGLRRTSHSYVPARPSRLSESISPESSKAGSARASEGGSEEHSFEREQVDDTQERTESDPRATKVEMRRFSGQKDSMRDVSFTFSPRRESSPGHLSDGSGPREMSTPEPTGKGSLKLFSLRDSVAFYPVNDEQGLETPLVSAGRKKREENRERQMRSSSGDLADRSEWSGDGSSPGREEEAGEIVQEEAMEDGTSTDEEMRERKPKRIRLDSPSVDSISASPASYTSGRRRSLRDSQSPAPSRRQQDKSLTSTPSSASDRSPSSFNDTQRLQFHIGLGSPRPRDGTQVPGNRQSWEQRGVEMLQHIRSRLLVDGNGNRSVAASPSTITSSGSEQSPESSGRREESYDGTVRERSESLSGESGEVKASIDIEGISPLIERYPAPRAFADDLPATRTSSVNTAIYVGPDRAASQTTSSVTVRPPIGPSGTVNSQSSGSGGTITTSGSGSTVTSKYLSAGMDIMDRIRERKFSESSGTMTGPDHEADARSASSAGRPSSSQSQNRPDVETRDERDDSTSDLRRSRMASLRAPPAPQPRQVRSVASSSSLSASSQGSGRPSSLPLNRPTSLAPPPSSTEDMNRFISATTVTTHRTTNTAVSTSFVKHRGPPSKPRGLQSMGLSDIPQIPSQVGKMVFDSQQLKWVRASGVRGASGIGTVLEEGESSEGSLDVFAGLESLRDDRAGLLRSSTDDSLQKPQHAESYDHTKNTEGDLEDREEWLTREVETRSQASAANIQPDQEDCASLDDVEVEVDEQSIRRSLSISRLTGNSSDGHGEEVIAQDAQWEETRPQLVHSQSAPTPLEPCATLDSTPLRSALRGPGSTPASALRKAATMRDSPAYGVLDSATKRNVSFSDGKRPGQIQTRKPTTGPSHILERSNISIQEEPDKSEGDVFRSVSSISTPKSKRQHPSSARSKRIHNLLEDIESESAGQPTPTRTSRGVTSALTESQLSSNQSSTKESDSDSGRVYRSTRRESQNKGDATFLTECSFAVSHDKLVEIITEVQPFEPYWEDLTAIDLSKRGATSVARLKEFLPKLDEVNLNDNEISYLSGIPSSVRTLFASGNKISSLTAINHLNNIQYLDLSRNDLDGVNALSCLRHLREIKLDHNRITDLGDLLQTDSLVKLSCAGNRITELDLRHAKWPRMEILDISDNDITGVYGLEKLTSLVTLNLERNDLTQLIVAEPMLSLRVLRVSNNNIADFDISSCPRLRTLYADNNSLSGLGRSNLRAVSRLENLSLRNQRGGALRLSYDDLRDVKRLYISGNPLPVDFFPSRSLYSMAYLEVAACKLSNWPADFASRLPNLRHLNLNYNFIEDLSGLRGMQGLRKLSVIGGRLGSTSARDVVADLRGLGTLESVDLRMNPCTLNFYLPIIVTDTAAFCSLRSQGHPDTPGSPSWVSMDVNFRRSLPDEWYSKRLIYRGLVAMACEGIQTIDGLQMTNAERAKARQLVESSLEDDP